MKRLALTLIALATVAGTAGPAHAQFDWRNLPVFSHWNINSMTTNEQNRINAGRANGSLTAAEAQRLQNRLNDINNLKARLSMNGLNANERNLIDQQLDRLAQDIYRESNDRQMLGNKPWGWSNNYRPNNKDWHYGHWDNGKWVTQNRWNDYNGWRNNKQWNWMNDGQRGSGMTGREQAQINNQRANLAQKEAAYRADGHLSRRERRDLERTDNRIDQRERRDRRD